MCASHLAGFGEKLAYRQVSVPARARSRDRETVSLNFRKFEVLYTLQEDSGAAGAETTAGWDIAGNEEWGTA